MQYKKSINTKYYVFIALPIRVFIGRQALQAEGVNTLLQLFGQYPIYLPVPGNAVKAREGGTDDMHAEMGFPFRVMPGMSGV